MKKASFVREGLIDMPYTMVEVTIGLTGCNTSYDTIILYNIMANQSNLEESEIDFLKNPQMFVVAPEEAKDSLEIYYSEPREDCGNGKKVKQELENIQITDDEIVIKTSEKNLSIRVTI